MNIHYRNNQVMILSTNPNEDLLVKIVHKNTILPQHPTLEAVGLLKINQYQTLILLGKFLDHRLTNIVRQDKLAGRYFPKFSPGMMLKDLIDYYHVTYNGTHVELLINAVINAHRTGILQQASPSSLVIEKARRSGAKQVSTISINPLFPGQPMWLLIDGLVDQVVDNAALLTTEVNEVICGLIPLYKDLPFLLNMQLFDSQRRNYIGLIPEGIYSAVAIPFYDGAFMEHMPM